MYFAGLQFVALFVVTQHFFSYDCAQMYITSTVYSKYNTRRAIVRSLS